METPWRIPRQQEAEAAAPARSIVISVSRDGVRLNQESLALDQLALRLATVLRKGGDVFVRGEPGLEFCDVARVVDVARGAGANRVGLMTQ